MCIRDRGCNFRSYSEMFFSAALTAEQTDAMYLQGLGVTSCEGGRFLTVGSPSGGSSGAALIFVHIPQGLPFGLLVHDMVERFLVHYFGFGSAHAYTRGTHTAPESSDVTDRDTPATAYTAAGEVLAPTYLKWMLCFEEPETRTLWLAKATPRGLLATGEAQIVAVNLTTRYGRVSYTVQAVAPADAEPRARLIEGDRANRGVLVRRNPVRRRREALLDAAPRALLAAVGSEVGHRNNTPRSAIASRPRAGRI